MKKTPLMYRIEQDIKAGDEGLLHAPGVMLSIRRTLAECYDRLAVLEHTGTIPRLVYRICYSETTPESAEHGEFSGNGVHDDEWHCETFNDVICTIKMFGEEGWSSHPHDKGCMHDWLQSGWSVQDHTVMLERQTSIHPLNPRALKYLEKAWSTLS